MAFDFVRASSQYLTTASTPVTGLPVTLAAFFKTANSADAQVAVTNNTVTNSSRVQLGCFMSEANDPFRMTCGDGLNNFANADILNCPISTWTQGSGTAVSKTATAFVNGGSKTSATENVLSTIGPFTQIGIGARHNGTSYGVYFDGQLAEIAIWSVELTDDEVASLGKGFKPTRIRPQSLVFYAPLVRDLQDLRGALTITNNNTATVADHPRVY